MPSNVTKKMPEITLGQKNALTAYTAEQHVLHGQTINNLLRAEQTCPEVDILEGMMTTGYTPNVLYRALENANVRVEAGIICDGAFLSTTSDMSYFMGFTATDLAILVIKNCAYIPSIDVVEILGNQNDEREYILPRNLPLQVRGIQHYSQNDFTCFLTNHNLQDEISAQELIDIQHINTITVYEVEPTKLIAEK